MAAPQRFDKEGRLIPPGPTFGFARHQDAARREEDAERRAWHEENAARGAPTPNEGVAAFLEAEAAFLEEHATQTDGPSDAQVFDDAIAAHVKAASERVEAAQRTPNQDLAREIAIALKGQVLETDAGDIYVPEAEEEGAEDLDLGREGFYPAGWDEDAENDETREIGWYELEGQAWYWDGSAWQSRADD
jgi:hypothetical protein